MLAAAIVVTFTVQPLGAWRAAFLAKLPGVAAWEATACNLSGAPRSISGGQIVQAAFERGIPVVSHRLNQVTAEAARRESKLYKVSRILSWLSWGGGVYVASRPQIKPEYKAGAVALAGAATMIAESFRARGVDIQGLDLLDPREVVQLGAYGQQNCASRLFLGGFRRDPVAAVEVH